MSKLSYILRVIALSILFGGSSTIIFAAITLVKAAEAKGVPVAQAAAANVPIFFGFSTIALVCAIILLAAESMDFAKRKQAGATTKARWATSALSVAATMVLAFGIIPPMKELIPMMKDNEQAHADFKKLHEASRGVFSAIILFALASLILPAFDSKRENSPS